MSRPYPDSPVSEDDDDDDDGACVVSLISPSPSPCIWISLLPL